MFIQQIINGLTIGTMYALCAAGYSMVFGILQFVNFAHGSVYMLGAFLTLTFVTTANLSFPIGFILSIIATGLVGVIMDRTAYYPIRRKGMPKMNLLIGTIGVSIFLQNLAMIVFGPETRNFPEMLELGNSVIFGVSISNLQVMIFIVTALIIAVLQFIVKKTRIGKAMRATAQNTEATKLMGVNVNRVVQVVFFIGSALACVAGTLVGMYYQTVDPWMGFMAGLKAFASAVLGGIGVLEGAMVGGLIIGVVETLAAGYIHAGYRDAIAFAVLILVLLVKPTGLMGKGSSRGV
jgi:branched-chain amino acid transport system permease protein